MHTNSSQRKTN